MFRTHLFKVCLGITLLMTIGGLSVFSQVQEHEVPALKSRALQNFESGAYDMALSDFRVLMRNFPRDAMYRYYTGVCLIEMDSELEEAIELLYYASSRGVPEDVYYYLGEGSRRLYDFEKAKSYFIEFDRLASRSLAREKNSKFLVRSINNAMQITTSYNPYQVLNVTFMDLKDPAQYGQIRMKGGSLQLKPNEFFSEGEDREDLNSLMFLPERVERGQFAYFSGLSRNGKDGFQIMRAKKSATGKWVDIQQLDALNSEGDEILPYFDPVGKDIYFASDGIEGLGGFDLFRAHYDEERDDWSEPVSLGFPVNSAYDDYLLLPGTDLGMVMFFTSRQATDSTLTVYRVHLSEPKQSLASSTPDEIRNIANLGDVAQDVLTEIQKYQAPQVQKPQVVVPEVSQNTTEGPETRGDISSTEVNPNYQSKVMAALRHQIVSDSLTELASDARIKVRESDDPNDRWLYQKQIMVWEKRAGAEQEKADLLYSEIAAMDANSPQEAALPEAIEKDTVINDITVYRYAIRDTISNVAQAVFKKTEVSETNEEAAVSTLASVAEPQPLVAETVSSVKKPMSRFEILAESAYSGQNPIPVDMPMPEGAFYRIQLGVFSSPVQADAFGGITPISAETVPDRNLIRYYAGKFSTYDSAQSARDKVRASGYQDAFIVSWYNGSKMSVEKVKKLE